LWLLEEFDQANLVVGNCRQTDVTLATSLMTADRLCSTSVVFKIDARWHATDFEVDLCGLSDPVNSIYSTNEILKDSSRYSDGVADGKTGFGSAFTHQTNAAEPLEGTGINSHWRRQSRGNARLSAYLILVRCSNLSLSTDDSSSSGMSSNVRQMGNDSQPVIGIHDINLCWYWEEREFEGGRRGESRALAIFAASCAQSRTKKR
jgi:hypothetical protein